MHYNGPVVRPPHEANSILLEVTVGCTHNRCRFCTFYRDTRFKVAPLRQVEEDLKEASFFRPDAKRVFAVGGDPFSLSVSKLKALASLVRQYLPQANIGTYARITSIFRKSVEELRELRSLGFNDLVIGVESGDDDTLKMANKGYTSQDIVRECLKLEAADINYYVIYLGGLAGRGKGEQNALRTAHIFNQLKPSHMYITSVAILPDSDMYQDVLSGAFRESTELERIKETLTLVRNIKNPIVLYGQSIANPVNFIAELPKDRTDLIRMLEDTIGSFTLEDESLLRRHRESLKAV